MSSAAPETATAPISSEQLQEIIDAYSDPLTIQGVADESYPLIFRLMLTQHMAGPTVYVEGRLSPTRQIHWNQPLPPDLFINAVAGDNSVSRRWCMIQPREARQLGRALVAWADEAAPEPEPEPKRELWLRRAARWWYGLRHRWRRWLWETD